MISGQGAGPSIPAMRSASRRRPVQSVSRWTTTFWACGEPAPCMHSTIGMPSVMFSMSRPRRREPRNFKSPFAAANPCLLPPAARHDRGRSQAPPGGRGPVVEAQEPIREASELLRGCSGGAGTGQMQDNFVSIHIILPHRRFTSGTLLPGQHQK